MTPPIGAGEILSERSRLDFVVDVLVERARSQPKDTSEEGEARGQRVRQRTLDLLDAWYGIARKHLDQGVQLQYQREVGAARRLLYEFLNPELKTVSSVFQKFRANRSMRDVEPNVNLWMRTLDDVEVEEDDT